MLCVSDFSWMAHCTTIDLYSMSEFVGTGKNVIKEKLSAVFLEYHIYFVDWKKCK